MDLIALPLAALLAWFAVQHQSATVERVVLLPEADGKVGAVVVKTPRGEELLNTPYASVRLDRAGKLHRDDDAQAVEKATRERYAQVLAARPPQPRSFTVYFETGSATELAQGSSRAALDDLKAFLATYPAPQITVIGHTDRVGTVEFNDQLSLKRAQTLRDLLVQIGVEARAMDVAGRGEREPLVPTADEVPEERNRRVEISVH